MDGSTARQQSALRFTADELTSRLLRLTRMVVIGITGGVGTGKSTVARLFGELGAAVIDADSLAHQVMTPGGAAYRRIVRTFGQAMLNPDGRINRPRLAALVFGNEAQRKRLERLVHPPVLRLIREEVARLRRAGRVRAVVLDVPLLIEAGARHLVDALVVVTAREQAQRRRLKRQRRWSEEEINARIGAQWALSAKVALADEIVDNSGGVEAARTQVTRIWKRLVHSSPNKRSSTSRP